MKPVPSTAVSARRLLRAPTAARLAVLVGALVVGILGMHALASHGTPTSSTPTTSISAPVQATAGEMPGHPLASSHHHPSVQPAHIAADDRTGSAHDMSSMVMLCAVMLAAAALTLLALLAVRPVGRLLPAGFHPAAAYAVPARWVRGTGPPHVWAFSVIRC